MKPKIDAVTAEVLVRGDGDWAGGGGEWGIDQRGHRYQVVDLNLVEAMAVAVFLRGRRSAVDDDTTEQEAD